MFLKGPNILIFVWISTLLLFYVRAYFSLSFYLIFTPWHTDPEVLGRCGMTFISHTCHDLPDFLQIFWITIWINVGPMIYISGEAHE